jgi:hypothetical protein
MHQRAGCPNFVLANAAIGFCKMSHRLEQCLDEAVRQAIEAWIETVLSGVGKSFGESFIELMAKNEAEKGKPGLARCHTNHDADYCPNDFSQVGH